MEKTVKKGRNSSIELLRIVCLVMIFWMHAADSGVANGISAWIDIAVAVIGNIGVSCFILISGYYGIRLDVKKMMHLECMLLFYSWRRGGFILPASGHRKAFLVLHLLFCAGVFEPVFK